MRVLSLGVQRMTGGKADLNHARRNYKSLKQDRIKNHRLLQGPRYRVGVRTRAET